MPALRLILAALFAALTASAVQAEIVGWRFMSGDLEATTSTCIGSDESPVCAAETIIACTVWFRTERSATGGPSPREHPEVCRAADSIAIDELQLFYLPGPAASRRDIYLYLLDIWRLPPDADSSRGDPTPGDVVVDIYTAACSEQTEHPRACAGVPFDRQERVGRCNEPDLNGFLTPEGTLAFRETVEGWRVSYFRATHTERMTRYPCGWRAERWRRDASDLLR